MSKNNTKDPYAILFAAITGTQLEDWTNQQHFSWDEGNIKEAPAGPSYGNDVFAIITMDHKDGRLGRVCYDLGDYVFFDCGELHWSGPLEADVHANATWKLDFEAAQKSRQKELAAEALRAQQEEQSALM
jgi:hypothetical protein